MRVEFAKAIIDHYPSKDLQAFLTGDLGFMALEEVRHTFGDAFINAGVAEQNMVTMAAAMAQQGFTPWVYSISPFVSLRPYEQIRNDVCLHNLPVKLVGNGGGYGYGIMGATHHNLEDIGAMRVLPNMKVYIPFMPSDVDAVVNRMLHDAAPNYLRLNTGQNFSEVGSFEEWRCVRKGTKAKAVVVGTGPVVANIINLPAEVTDQLEVWVIGVIPVSNIPDEFINAVEQLGKVIVIEEHYAAGGLGEYLAGQLLSLGLSRPLQWLSLHAKGYPNGRYGSQSWHQELNELKGTSLLNRILTIL